MADCNPERLCVYEIELYSSFKHASDYRLHKICILKKISSKEA